MKGWRQNADKINLNSISHLSNWLGWNEQMCQISLEFWGQTDENQTQWNTSVHTYFPLNTIIIEINRSCWSEWAIQIQPFSRINTLYNTLFVIACYMFVLLFIVFAVCLFMFCYSKQTKRTVIEYIDNISTGKCS